MHPLITHLNIALVVVCAACSPKTRRTPDDTLVVVVPSVIRDMDPRFALTNHDVKLSRLIAPGLTSVDSPDLQPRMELAESVDQVDERTWDITLKEGISFSDGTPVTPEDVVFSYASVLDPETDSLYRTSFSERYERIEATGERTVRFHLVEPLATFLTDLDFGIIKAAAANDARNRFPDGMVVGAGPFRIVSIESETIRWERNPHYWGEAAHVEKVELRTVRDANARTLMLIGGSADFTQNAIRVDLVDSVVERDRVHAVSGPSAILTYLMMNNADPVLRDVRVRRAIAHAVDRRRIVEAKMLGRAVLATGLIPPSHWAYNADVPRYDYDPERAKQLLDEAGYPDPDGPGGEPRLRLLYKTSADQFRLTIARIIASQLGEVGIEVEVRSFEFGTFFADIKRGSYQIATMQTADITEPDFYYTYFHSERIPTDDHPNTHNRWRYENELVDRLTLEGRSVTDRDTRYDIYARVQDQVARDVPVVPLWHEDNVAIMNADVSGYEVYPNARYFGFTKIRKE